MALERGQSSLVAINCLLQGVDQNRFLVIENGTWSHLACVAQVSSGDAEEHWQLEREELCARSVGCVRCLLTSCS